MKVLTFKTFCNYVAKAVLWEKIASYVIAEDSTTTHWENENKDRLAINRNPKLEMHTATFRPAAGCRDTDEKRCYLTDSELSYVNGLIERRQAVDIKGQWPLSINTELRGGERLARVRTTFNAKSQIPNWRHHVIAFPGADKKEINYEVSSFGPDGTKLHCKLVGRIYQQLIGKTK